MPKALPPEIQVLVPNGIENLTLYCTVCRDPLPASRRKHGHHAGACHRVAVMYRRYVMSLTRCITCLHPSTPEERADFKLWRQDRGRRKGRGRPKNPLDKPETPETPREPQDTALCDAKYS